MWPNLVIQKNVALISLSVSNWGLWKISKMEWFAKIINELLLHSPSLMFVGSLDTAMHVTWTIYYPTLHRKWSFPLKISVNVNKSAGNGRFGHILQKKSLEEIFIFCAVRFDEFTTRFQRAFKRHLSKYWGNKLFIRLKFLYSKWFAGYSFFIFGKFRHLSPTMFCLVI